MSKKNLSSKKLSRKQSRKHIFNRFKRDEEGVAAVEFGLVAFPFFLLLSAIIEASIFFFAGQMLESAVDRVGRQIRTGQLDSNTSQTQMKAAVCSEASLLFNCSGLLVDVAIAANFSALGDPPGPTSGVLDPGDFGYAAPASEAIMRVTVTYEWPVFSNYVASHMANLGSGNALLSAMSVFKTEAW